MKKGASQLSRITNSPIVPIYVDNTGGLWTFVVGEPINPEEYQSLEEIAQEYLDQMKFLMGIIQDRTKVG